MINTISYLNGNYMVIINPDGKRVFRGLRIGEEFNPKFPDSIDLKITNKCNRGCPFCHESSNSTGKHFDMQKTLDLLSPLKNIPIELAIGGGNILEYPNIIDFLDELNLRGNKARVTLNSLDILENTELTKEIVKRVDAIGISVKDYKEFIKIFREKEKIFDYYSGYDKIKVIVFHIIAGIFPPEDIHKIVDIRNEGAVIGLNFLVLGYKQWGRAKNTELPKSMTEFKDIIKNCLWGLRNGSVSEDITFSFDNLALEQLEIENSLLKKEWESNYTGDEFSHTMYIDAVEEKFAPTSRDPFRVSWNDMSLLEFFNTYRK